MLGVLAILTLLIPTCSTAATPPAEEDDILDMVMPAILASANSSKSPTPGPNQKLMTFSKLAKTLGKSQEINVSVAHYTDLLSVDIKSGGCTHQHVVTAATYACDTWKISLKYPLGKCTHQHVVTAATYACDTWSPSYKRNMNCDYYAHVNADFYMLTQKDLVSTITGAIAKDIADFSKARITDAVNLTIAESTVAAAGAAIYSEGIGAIPVFVTTFNNTITPNLDTAKQQITDHVTHLDFIDSVSGLTAPVKVDTKPICGWGRWSRI